MGVHSARSSTVWSRSQYRFPAETTVVTTVLNYAKSLGVTTVVSAGNLSWDLDHNSNLHFDFCDNPGVICVSATGPTAQASVDGPWTNVDAPASYSNFGRSAIDVAAPGGDHNSYVWAACSQTSLVIPACPASPF